MSALNRIRAHGGDVQRDGCKLILRRGRMSDEAVGWVRDNRDRILAEVWPAHDEWAERAAIREFDGGQDRAAAETDALREVEARC